MTAYDFPTASFLSRPEWICCWVRDSLGMVVFVLSRHDSGYHG
ncbi:MAG: hypothetical protein RQM89_10590 [Acetomicrobium sp.]